MSRAGIGLAYCDCQLPVKGHCPWRGISDALVAVEWVPFAKRRESRELTNRWQYAIELWVHPDHVGAVRTGDDEEWTRLTSPEDRAAWFAPTDQRVMGRLSILNAYIDVCIAEAAMLRVVEHASSEGRRVAEALRPVATMCRQCTVDLRTCGPMVRFHAESLLKKEPAFRAAIQAIYRLYGQWIEELTRQAVRDLSASLATAVERLSAL